MSRPPSLDELRAQARQTFRYWPIYLMLRLRQLEQHLSPEERAHLGMGDTQEVPRLRTGDTAILREYGLLSGDEALPVVDVPPAVIPLADSYRLEVRASGATVSLFMLADSASVELLRVRTQDQATLEDAAQAFQRMSDELSPQMAYDAARLWAALHGARLLDWISPAQEQAPEQSLTLALPPRKRGRGAFREPG